MQLSGKIVAPNKKSEWIGYHINSWLTFSNVNGLVISGRGQIDGQGSAWWPQPCLQDNVCTYAYICAQYVIYIYISYHQLFQINSSI